MNQGTKVIPFSDTDLAKTIQRVRENAWPFLKQDIGEAFDEVVSSVRN